MQNPDVQYQLHVQQQQISDLQRQASQLQRLTAAIRSMYSEFYSQNPVEDEPALITLDKLRSQLRILIQTKKSGETIMRAGLNSADDDCVRKLDDKVLENRKLVQDILKLQQKLEEQNERLRVIDKCHDEEIQRIKIQNKQMREENAKMKELETQLKDAVVERDRLIKNRDTRLGRIAELETKLQQKDIDNQNAIHQAQTSNVKQINELLEEQKIHLKQIQEAADKDVQIKELKMQLRSVKENLNVRHLESAQQQVIELNKKLQLKNAENTEINQVMNEMMLKFQRMELDYNHREAQFQQLAKENEDLTTKKRANVNQSQKVLTKEEKEKITQHYSALTYEEKLKDKDKEIDELASRVRRLLALQHKANLAQKSFQDEKQILEKQIQAQREEISQLRKLQVGKALPEIAQKEVKTVTVNEDLMRDLQNMKAFGVTANSVFNSKTTGRIQKSRPLTGQKVFELDEVPDTLRPATGKKMDQGKGYGFGAGQMLGGLDVEYKFGVK
ncbi:Spindle_pole protein [Hexamita inflata]|uniref:Putative n=2 Tax=Hexamita inflata TaxID=28002 RepID=A0AA86RGE7_9EUKA|nr:Spindle pole protein [Hexamita inflata]